MSTKAAQMLKVQAASDLLARNLAEQTGQKNLNSQAQTLGHFPFLTAAGSKPGKFRQISPQSPSAVFPLAGI